MYKKKEYKKLRYIYYEIYNRKEDNKKIIYNSLVNLRNCNNIDYIYNHLKIKNIVIEK